MSTQAVRDSSVAKLKSAYAKKLQYFQSLIYANETVDITALRQACASGIPEGHGIRAVTWKLMLHLLPVERSKWKETLTIKRKQYQSFCEGLLLHELHGQDFIVDPKAAYNGFDLNPLDHSPVKGPEESAEKLQRKDSDMCDVTKKDHPLALDAFSKWNLYFRDNEIRDQIDRDVMRTHPDMHFFSGDSTAAEIHREEIKRALFVFAKLNPGLNYVQGMNEIYAPLYYVFKTNEHGEYGERGGFGSIDHAEADAFFCFVDLMSEFRDNFCKQLDNSSSGVRATISKFSNLLLNVDPVLWDHLKFKTQVDLHYFAFRWITLLLTQEFSFPDVLRLWDTLGAAPPNSRQDFLQGVCIAMLLSVREELLQGDYAQNLKLLQQFPGHDMNDLIQTASRIDKAPAHE